MSAKRPLRGWTRASAVGLEMGIAVVLGLVVGGWVDERWGSEPWGALIGLILGSAVGFRALIRIATQSSDDDDPS